MKPPGFSPSSQESQQQDTENISRQDLLRKEIDNLLDSFPEGSVRDRWERESENMEDEEAIQFLQLKLSEREKVINGNDGYLIKDPSLREEIQKVVEDLERVEQQGLDIIGKGNYGRVHVSPHSHKVCIKYLIDKIQMESHQKAIVNEAGFLNSLHGFVVEGVRVPDVYSIGLNNPPYYLGMERIYGKSLEAIKTSPEDSQDFVELIKSQDKEQVISKITQFIKQMHIVKRIIHGDIHAGNIMIDKKGNWYVIDFGLSMNIDFDDDSTDLKEKDILNVRETIEGVYNSI